MDKFQIKEDIVSVNHKQSSKPYSTELSYNEKRNILHDIWSSYRNVGMKAEVLQILLRPSRQ
jgi:predicted metal-dependent hydrolase